MKSRTASILLISMAFMSGCASTCGTIAQEPPTTRVAAADTVDKPAPKTEPPKTQTPASIDEYPEVQRILSIGVSIINAALKNVESELNKSNTESKPSDSTGNSSSDW